MTWILVCICSPAAFKNPYLIAKLIEVLFVLNPSIQPKTEILNNMMMSHSLSMSHLPSALMKFYTGMVIQLTAVNYIFDLNDNQMLNNSTFRNKIFFDNIIKLKTLNNGNN